MASEDSFPTLKVLLIGPSGAGKSACEFSFFPFFFSSSSFCSFSPYPRPFHVLSLGLGGRRRRGRKGGRQGESARGLLVDWPTDRPTDRLTD